MKDFVYSYPVKVYFGEKAAAKALPVELQKVGKTVMLAYGGGSVIDCCKIIAAQAVTARDIWEMEFVRYEFARMAEKVWEIPAEGKTREELALAGVEALADFQLRAFRELLN